jgi:hypothetical protein
MKDCSTDILNYHNDEVTLPPATREKLRGNRNANRDRLKRGLERNKDPMPDSFIIQGSYAMKTMTQHESNDYDIDDGAAFAAEKLKKGDGASLTPQEAKEMVRDALIEGGGLVENPSVKKNCVRVKYTAGHHVDIPFYRILDGEKELAGEIWRDSNPTEITDWFVTTEKKTQGQGEAEPQLRRLVRLVKRYSRRNLDGNSLSGLLLTVLTAEQHTAYDVREDRAFREVLRKIRNRLLANRTVNNPANPAEKLSKDTDAEKVTALINQIADSLKILEVLDRVNCRRSEALKAWKQVLKTEFFDSEIKKAEETEKSQASAAIASAAYVPKPWGF